MFHVRRVEREEDRWKAAPDLQASHLMSHVHAEAVRAWNAHLRQLHGPQQLLRDVMRRV